MPSFHFFVWPILFTWNSIVGHKSNVWSIQELFKKQEAEARRLFLSNATGHDMHANSGRKQKSLDSRQRIKFVVEAFETMPPSNYISTIAHDLQNHD